MSAVVNPELVDTVRRAGELLMLLAERLADGRADLPLAVEQLGGLTRELLSALSREVGR